jgi:hypothetical protein
MHRIDSPNALPGGFFTEGDPVIPVPATEVSDDWLNAVQEEMAAVITAAEIALDKKDNAQLLAAIAWLIEKRVPPGVIPGCIMSFSGTFGGDAGRNPIPRGGGEPNAGWLLCDGGSDGNGGTVPDLRGRMILGADDAHQAGTTGGANTHTHGVSTTSGAATLAEWQIASHAHSTTLGNWTGDNQPYYQGAGTLQGALYTNAAGGSGAHAHSVSATTGAASNLPAYYALAYIIKL